MKRRKVSLAEQALTLWPDLSNSMIRRWGTVIGHLERAKAGLASIPAPEAREYRLEIQKVVESIDGLVNVNRSPRGAEGEGVDGQ